ncbi:MAG: flagellar basal body-associated FliL family protein [Pseudomonadota bacterium]
MAENAVSSPPVEPQRTSPLGLAVVLVVLTVLGAAGGGGFAVMQVDRIATATKERANKEPEKIENTIAWSEETATAALAPVVTNLASPSSVWVRLETTMVFDKDGVDDVERLRAEMAQDVLAFLRTMTLGELEGASALAHLRDDLNERARIATQGVVQEIIIQSMVLQ